MRNKNKIKYKNNNIKVCAEVFTVPPITHVPEMSWRTGQISAMGRSTCGTTSTTTWTTRIRTSGQASRAWRPGPTS